MKTKITSHNFKIDIFKGLLTTVMLLSSVGVFAQIIVESVTPTRVTTRTRVAVRGAAPNTFQDNMPVLCQGIFTPTAPQYGTVSILGGRGIAFVIVKNTVFPGDVESQALMIDGQTVHTATPPILGLPPLGNQVFLEYVAPAEKNYNSDSDFRVTEVFTSWDKDGTGFWRSGPLGTEEEPNDRHDLLGFTTPGGTYSTGVSDNILINNGVTLTSSQTFKAYSTNGVSGKTHDQNYLAMADLIDGRPNEIITNNLVRATVYDVLIDGKNGLDMGSGITNLNRSVSIQFFSGNGNVGALDNVPDLLITQIADPGKADIYFYGDIDGNIVGRPILLSIPKSSPKLFDWRLDLYNMTQNVSYDVSYPTGAGFSAKQKRAFRMVAFRLQDFDIDNEEDLNEVNNINMMAGGEADIAFIAYNTDAFAIKSPQIEEFPVSRNICELSNTIEVTFKTTASVVAPTDNDDREILSYQWYRNFEPILGEISNSYTLPAPITESDLSTYKVRVKNGFGAIDLPVTLSRGGIPTYWNGSTEGWVFPSNYYNGPIHTTSNLKFPIDNSDRNLIFAEDYSEEVDLEGCDCVVIAGKNVTIPAGRKLKLFDTIIVEDEILADPSSGSSYIPAGTFTLKNNASLIQTKDVDENENTGKIIVERDAENLIKYDYVYWSSPVENGNMSMIPGATQHIYSWDVNQVDANQTLNTRGNWVGVPLGIMQNGRGYIKRVNNSTKIESAFVGEPNNGTIYIDVFKTSESGSEGMKTEERHSNLLGNPYPSSISAKTFLEINTELKGHVQVWTHKDPIYQTDSPFYENFKYNYGDQYATYNLTGSVGDFNGYIASGQGFFVKVMDNDSNPSPPVIFNNKMRYDPISEEAYDNDDFKRGVMLSGDAVQTEKQLIWLSLVNESNISSVTLVGYAEGATNGKDRLYDASSGGGDMRLYSVLEDSDFLIQGRALPFEDSDKVPLGIEILKNGIYKIGIDHLKGSLMLNEEQGIYIEDIYNNVIHDLKNAPYSFTATVGEIKDRFVLRYTNETLSADDKQVSDTFVYVKNEQLYVKASKNIESVVVYDLTGKKLMDYKLDGYADRFNAQFQFPKGAYLTVIKLENTGTVTKKILN